jgi:hypothetical protein
VWDRLLATAGAAERRFLVQIGLAHGWWSADVVFALAVTDTDVWVRVRAAELVCRQAVWSERVDTLRQLARHPGAEVRQVALTGLLRLGHATEVAAYLDDRAPLIRAIAREAARRADIDALPHYRYAVSEPEPATAAIAGLAETGGAADANLLVGLLVHPRSRVRAQAVRALRHLARHRWHPPITGRMSGHVTTSARLPENRTKHESLRYRWTMSGPLPEIALDEAFKAPTICLRAFSDDPTGVDVFTYDITPEQVKEGWMTKARMGEPGEILASDTPDDWINKFDPEDGATAVCTWEVSTPVFNSGPGQRLIEEAVKHKGLRATDQGWKSYDKQVLKFFTS